MTMSNVHCFIWCVLLLFVGFIPGTALAADEPLRLPAIKDNSIVLVDGEWHVNAGDAPRIRVKGNQHLVVLGFDTTSLQGRRVTRAKLVCFAADHELSGVTISTLATPWDELASTGLSAGRTDVVDWGYPGAKMPAVCGGNAFTLTVDAREPQRDGRYEWELPPQVVESLSLGVAHGLVIHEHDVDYSRNPTIFAREQSGKGPYLLVEVDPNPQPDSKPAPPSDLRIIFDGPTEARLTLQAPESGFAYEVKVNEHELGRHNIPLLLPSGSQTVFLRDLPPEVMNAAELHVQVVTLQRTGQRSSPVTLTVPRPIFEPIVDEPPPPLASTARPTDLAVIPVLDKYDRDGQPIGTLPADYRWRNPLFDGREVRLTAAAGEVVSLQLLLRGKDFVGVEWNWGKKDKDVASPRVDWFVANYVESDGREVPDPLLPMPPQVSLSPQQDTVLVADIYVPFDRAAGETLATVNISDGREIPIRLEILPFALPRTATFHCDMNSYGLPDDVQHYYALQQVAYDHRVSCNVLHYGHHTAAPGARKSNLDMRLGNGRRMDNRRYDEIAPGAQHAYWDDFITAFEPVLSGSLFQDGHRGPIPIPAFYLTFHESWPLNCRAYFNGNLDAYKAFTDEPLYAQTYANILQDFSRLAAERGWNTTDFQVYFNNKGSLSEATKAPWILDEPASFWDYRALQYYADLTDRGLAQSPIGNVDYRVDISRPEFCRGQWTARRSTLQVEGHDTEERVPESGHLWVVSSWAFQNYARLVQDRIQQEGLKVWVYGTANHVHENNRTMQAWALDSWLGGAQGVVPWQTVDKTGRALTEADQLGLFIFDHNDAAGFSVRHSLRLKAFRDAEQLIAYLSELERREGWTRAQTRTFVRQHINGIRSVAKVNEADAGTPTYPDASATNLENLKRASTKRLRFSSGG
jgi:hypothetical protein